MSKRAIDAMLPFLTDGFGNPSSIHSLGQRSFEALESARGIISRRLDCETSEVYFTSGGTESDNLAIHSAVLAGIKNGRRHIVTSKTEHHAVLNTISEFRDEGLEVTYLDVGLNGSVDPSLLERSVRPDTALVSIMYANNETGVINPVSEIGRICKERGILFHTDAVQAVGHIPLSFRETGADYLSFSGHKLHGPKGVGVLISKKNAPLLSLIKGGSQERGKRAGTENVGGICSMAEALDESCESFEESVVCITALRDRLIDGLLTIPGTVINGGGERLPGIVNVSFEGTDGESIVHLLDFMGIAASTGAACTSASGSPSHVLLAMGKGPDIAKGSVRFSLDRDNTVDEIDTIIGSVKNAVSRIRGLG